MSKSHWLALASISGLGSVTARRLIARFGDVESVFTALPDELLEIPRVNEAMVQQLRAVSLEQLEQELYALSDQEIDLLTWDDPRFPAPLRELSDAPMILFVYGTLKPDDERAVAIVGTRSPSESGVETATRLARELALRGLAIVSGLALGIDAAAHRGALDAEDGRTLAILGSGIRMIHPRANVELAAQIAEHGAVLSELMPNTPPRGLQLMARDRIISGLSRAVIVVEASEKSGSLDTAQRAKKQGRLILAVPGSEGTDLLIRGGAEGLEPEGLDVDALVKRIEEHPRIEEKPAAPKQGSFW